MSGLWHFTPHRLSQAWPARLPIKAYKSPVASRSTTRPFGTLPLRVGTYALKFLDFCYRIFSEQKRKREKWTNEMKLNLIEILGDGGFADVWRATDELDRNVAVKIIRPANVGVADALAHAKALARAQHPNVVSVMTLERIPDPQSGNEVDCVVMELIEGETLAKLAKGPKLEKQQALTIGREIMSGLSHIHKQGMAHGDLHEENVMIADGHAKIIDILYLNSLASLSTEDRTKRVRRDLLSLRIILQQVILHSQLASVEATEFNNLVEVDATIEDIDEAFVRVFSPATDERAVDNAYAHLIDEDFIEGEDYATALSDETPDSAILPLLKRVVSENNYKPAQQHYISMLWERLNPHSQSELIQELGKSLDANIPKGDWPPAIRLLKIFGKDGWNYLSARVRIKIETAIVKDVLAGNKDIHSVKNVSGGALGTYASSLWRRFSKPEILADNIITLLNQNWFTQNYVAGFFLRSIPAISRATGKRAEFIKAIRTAVANDARLIVSKIDEVLPDDWVEEIRK